MHGIFITSLALALILLFRVLVFPSQQTSYIPGQSVELEGVIWDEPRRTQFAQRFQLDGLTISTSEYPEYTFGEVVRVAGVVEENSFTSSTGKVITELVVKNPRIDTEKGSVHLQILVWMIEKIKDTITRTLPTNEAALLLGITLGIKSEFSKEMLDLFTATGIVHVVAASGSNVATLVGLVLYTINYFVGRRLAIGITILFIAWYSMLAGFDPPIVRASIMALIVLVAQLIGKQNHSLFALGFTVWVMLMIDIRLIYEVGFLLSITATGGIVLLKPILDQVLRIPWALKDDVSTTIAAQIGSLPILLSAFGNFAPLSILLNVLILWTVPVIMILGLMGSVVALIHPVVALPFLYGAFPFLVYFLTIVSYTSPLITPFTVSNFSIILIASYYVVSLSIILFLKHKVCIKNR